MPKTGHGVIMKECRTIRELLSAMLDHAVTPAEQQRIDRHLAACPRCREALAELEKTVALLRRQEPVEPPPWLTTRIMARIAEEAAPKRTLWQRLFQPWPVKVPLQALALVALCITGYLLSRENIKQVDFSAPTRQEAPAPRPEPSPEAPTIAPPPPPVEKRELAPATPEPAPLLAPPPAPLPAAAPPPRAKSTPAANDFAPAPPAPSLQQEAPELHRAPASTFKSLPAPATERAFEAPAAAPQLLRDQASPPAAAKRRAAKEEATGGAGVRPLAPVIIRLAPRDAATIGNDLAALTRRLGGTTVAARATSITLRLPTGRYRDLLYDLQQLGTLATQPPPVPAPDAPEQQVTISW